MWFAFKLVSLNHWIQPNRNYYSANGVVICFQISIFEPLNTAVEYFWRLRPRLWFAFKLVSLNHWIQRLWNGWDNRKVVICFQISIFEPLNTAVYLSSWWRRWLWFAFKLVSLNHWIQLNNDFNAVEARCDLLSN